MAEKQYQLTPTGLVVLAVMNGVIKISLETNTTPNALKFDREDIYNKSEPQLTEKAVDKVISLMLFGGLMKRA